ncbi:hypothetical protein [Companilactobacillus zhachilii]|nr:hypothetical protein [Companilactobacillus zhachilii]
MIFEKNLVEFDTDVGNKTKSVYRKLPETLTITENYSHKYTIYGTGSAPAVTITFVSTLTRRKYTYKVQLGWGEIIEKKYTT